MQEWDFDSEPDPNGGPANKALEKQIADAIREAEKDEREACAKIADAVVHSRGVTVEAAAISACIAEVIRTRKS